MNCRQCGNKVRVNFANGHCSSTCAGIKPKEPKPRRIFAPKEETVVYVDAGSDDMMMPIHYEIVDDTPEKVAKRHEEKVKAHNVRNALKREFQELRCEK